MSKKNYISKKVNNNKHEQYIILNNKHDYTKNNLSIPTTFICILNLE